MNRPPITRMAKGFVLTMFEWAMAGCPVRHPEEIREIFETHCRPCEFFNPGRNLLGKPGYCEKCGCHVSQDPDDVLNKIRDPLVGCPLDNPKWRRSVTVEPKPNRKE